MFKSGCSHFPLQLKSSWISLSISPCSHCLVSTSLVCILCSKKWRMLLHCRGLMVGFHVYPHTHNLLSNWSWGKWILHHSNLLKFLPKYFSQKIDDLKKNPNLWHNIPVYFLRSNFGKKNSRIFLIKKQWFRTLINQTSLLALRENWNSNWINVTIIHPLHILSPAKWFFCG